MLTTLILLACATAGANDTFNDGLTNVLGSHDTNVKLSPDGKHRVERAFDGEGRLTRFTIVEEGTPSKREEIALSYTPTLSRRRTVHEDAALVLRENATFDSDESLITRETIQRLGSKFTRTVATLEGLKVILKVYRLGAGASDPFNTPEAAWEFVETRERPAINASNDDAVDAYASCLHKRGDADDTGDCADNLNDLANPLQRTLEISAYAPLACKTKTDMFLPNGYRIDVKSCIPTKPKAEKKVAQAAVNSLIRATNRVSDEMLRCLGEVNQTFALLFVKTLQTKRPRLYCAGRKGSQKEIIKRNCKGKGKHDCADEYKGHFEGKSTVAFSEGNDGKGLFLIAGDPIKDKETRDEQSEINQKSLTGTLRSRMESRVNTNGMSMAQTLFHETLHETGIYHPETGNDPANPDDVVYSCTKVCAGPGYGASLESCNSCAHALGNKPKKATLSQTCGWLPPNTTIVAFNNATILQGALTMCEQDKCDRTDESVTALCKKTDKDAKCKELLKADIERQLKEARALPGGKQAWKQWEAVLRDYGYKD